MISVANGNGDGFVFAQSICKSMVGFGAIKAKPLALGITFSDRITAARAEEWGEERFMEDTILWATDLIKLGRCCLRPIYTDPFLKPVMKGRPFGPCIGLGFVWYVCWKLLSAANATSFQIIGHVEVAS